jgi:hypothetical protein
MFNLNQRIHPHGGIPMKLSLLLSQRTALLRHARLANLAFAYTKLGEFARRISRAQLTGSVTLKHAAPGAGQFWSALTALEGNQSVIEEHFTDEDIADLADIVAFTTGASDVDLTFRIEELEERFLAPLRPELEQAGIVFDHEPLSADGRESGGAGGHPQIDGGG